MRFGFALQLYGPERPLAISRSLCVGQAESDCCVFNLCNALLGVPGACVAICLGTEIELSWRIDWDGSVGDNFRFHPGAGPNLTAVPLQSPALPRS